MYHSDLPFPQPLGLTHESESKSVSCSVCPTLCDSREELVLARSQIRSVAQSCPTLCNPMNRSMPGLPVHHQSLVFPLINTPVLELAAATAKSLQSCLTVWYPIDGSPPGSPVPRILQARTLEWVAISFSNAWKWKVKVKLLSHARLVATHGWQPTRLLHPWDFPGKSTGVGCHCLLRLDS